MEQRLFLWQRLSAVLLAVAVSVHLALILYASHDGLSAAEILARTRANPGWAAFYILFVVAAAVHAPIGLRNVMREWTALPRPLIDGAMAAFALALLLSGLRAVSALY